MISFKNFLIEGRDDDFRKDASVLSKDDIEFVIDNDPSPSKKYLKWIASRLNEVDKAKGRDYFFNQLWTNSFKEKLMDDISEFDRKIKGIDIYSLKSFGELDKVLHNRVISKKEQLTGDIDVIADTDDWLVVAPKSHDASQHYGGSTKWCISTSNEGYWDQYYNEQGRTIVMLKNRNLTDGEPYWKIAIVGDKIYGMDTEAYDVQDIRLTNSKLKVFIEALPKDIYSDIVQYFKDERDSRDERREEQDLERYIKQVDQYVDNNLIKDFVKYLKDEFTPENEEMNVGEVLDIPTMFIDILGGEVKIEKLFKSIFMDEGSDDGYREGFYSLDMDDRFDNRETFIDYFPEEKDELKNLIKFIESFSDFHEGLVEVLNKSYSPRWMNTYWEDAKFEEDFEKWVYGKSLKDHPTLSGFESSAQPFHTPPTIRTVSDVIEYYKKVGNSEMISYLASEKTK